MTTRNSINCQDIEFLLSEGEGQYIEFKEKLDKTFTRELVGFANASGGRIFLGVSDRAEIKGFKIDNKIRSQIQDLARNCDPAVIINLTEQQNILIVEIKEGVNKPYSCSDGFFLRVGANSQKLKRDEIIQFSVAEGKIKFDEQICEAFDVNKEIDPEKLQKYLRLADLSADMSDEDILINLGVAIKKESQLLMRNAGLLLFASNPGRFIKSSKVICVEYQTNEKINVLDRKIYDDGVINNIENAINYVKKHINTSFEINSLHRKEIMQFPEAAFREAIINSIVHRDYLNESGDIMIEIFKNKIIISNPGGLVSWLPVSDFGKYSRPRNNLLASLLSRTSYVEKMGTGINRIKEIIDQFMLPLPEFDFNEYNFAVVLYDNHYLIEKDGIGKEYNDHATVEKTVERTVEKTVEKILELIRENKKITQNDLSKRTGLTRRGVEWNLAKLKEKELIKRIGPPRGGYWEILD